MKAEMGSKMQPADRVYEDFEPFYEWNRDERLVNVMLPGFRKDEMKVQVTSKRSLRLMGERLMFGNRWRRFNLELPLLSDYDTDNVTAKFEGAKLSVKFGELTQPNDETIPHPSQKAVAKTNSEVSDQKTPQQEETKTDATDKAAPEAKTNDLSESQEAPTPSPPKTRLVSRSITRLIDFSLGSGNNHVDDGITEDLAAGRNMFKKYLKWLVLIYLLLVLVGLALYYGNNPFTSYPEEFYFLDL